MLAAAVKTISFSILELTTLVILALYFPLVFITAYILVGIWLFVGFSYLRHRIPYKDLPEGSPLKWVLGTSSYLKILSIALFWPLWYIKAVYHILLVLIK